MSITHITSNDQLSKLLSSSQHKLSVIDFHATWCGPCHAIAPAYEALAKQYKSVNFFKCDVDQAQEVARKYAVSAMPTFIFLKGSTKVDQVRGADVQGLENAIKKHSTGPGGPQPAFAGKGQTLGEAASPVQGLQMGVANIDPQIKLLLVLLGAYILLWFFFS